MKFKIVNKPSQTVLELVERVKKEGMEKGFVYTDDEDADLVIAIGGDGTLLRAVKEGKPIVGVKAGRRGFLMDVPKERVGEIFDRLKEGDYKEEEYLLIEGDYNGRKIRAFNEIGIMFDRPESIQLSVKFRSTEIIVEGDGILISTPQGSSGWSMSITRNLICSKLNVLEVVFVNPIYQPLRSVVVDAIPIKVRMLDKGYVQTARIVADGEVFSTIKTREELVVSPVNEKAKVFRFFDLDPVRESLWIR
ncbi:NAD(+)/NADH kinase [Sulfuracidifex tepidarius]|uniref:NAD kinase n=1 Tax=Sulfuracidifex tepidarius TaxID=1294262 RepID=A0A510DYK4_9CREN|nr:NAD(+)/NADH kinase [Sulfuracidifex tepidarius]BBG25314.1 NAD kinase [Sulfuracidifex tepidarius]BBG28108.1 NAD kinase [Sulfuracidifex tepidarius]